MPFPKWPRSSYGPQVCEIGEGVYSKIVTTQDDLALKITDNDGPYIPSFVTLREINALTRARSNYVIPLLDVVVEKKITSLVLPLAESNLSHSIILRSFKPKVVIRQIILGLIDLANADILHLDLKPDNILIRTIEDNGESQTKVWLADFGLSAIYSKILRPEKLIAFTPSYRPPEVFLGCVPTQKALVWVLGIIILEILLTKKNGFWKPYFNGVTEEDIFRRILEFTGEIQEKNWPGITQLLLQNNVITPLPKDTHKILLSRGLDEDDISLLEWLLVPNPDKRPSISCLLTHPWFESPILPSSHISSWQILQRDFGQPINLWHRLNNRRDIIDKIKLVGKRIDVTITTLAVTIHLLDYLRCHLPINRDAKYLIHGIASFYLAASIYETEPPDLEVVYDVVRSLDLIKDLRLKTITRTVKKILNLISFDLTMVTSYHLLKCATQQKQAEVKWLQLAVTPDYFLTSDKIITKIIKEEDMTFLDLLPSCLE